MTDIEKIMSKLKQREYYENNNIFYTCHTIDCPRYTFNEAMEISFQCAICKKALSHYDNTPLISALEKKINKLSRS